jgi:hypothetical protein
MDTADAGVSSTTARFPARRVDLLSIGSVGVVLAVLLRPFQPTPFIDDWAYAFPVQQLVDTGTLKIPEYSNPALVHMLYGAVWCLPFGFSFVTLGLSTWTLWIALQLGVYGLILELGGTRRNALVGAAISAFFPTCFGLAASFMTDVPFLAAETWSTFFFVRALQQRREPLIWIAALIAGLGIGVRLIGLVIPCAMIAVLALHAGPWGRHPRRLLGPLLCLPFAPLMLGLSDAFTFVSADVSYVSNSPQYRIAQMPIALRLAPRMFPSVVAEAALFVGIAILPAAVGTTPRSRRHCLAAGIAGSAVALLADPVTDWIPFGKDNLWLIGETWGTPGVVPGWTPRVQFSSLVRLLTMIVGFTAVALLVASVRAWRLRADDWFAAWALVGLALTSTVLWLFNNDRYALVYLPIAVAFLLSRVPDVRQVPTLAGLAVYGLICIVSTHDHRIYNRTLWTAVERLRADGIPAAQIDAGYTVNAWLQYVRPDQAHREPDGRITIPNFNEMPEVNYIISNSVLPDTRIVDTVPYSGWYGPGRLYVLSRSQP